MQRLPQNLIGRTKLNDFAEIHHRYPIGNVFYDGKIVRNKKQRQIHFAANFREKIDDLRLDRNVERRDGLIRHNQFWFDRQRARNRDALALAAGKFVRIFFHRARQQTNFGHERRDTRTQFGARDFFVGEDRFRERIENSHPRVERCVGILKDHLKIRACASQFARFKAIQVSTLENDVAVGRWY